MVKKIRNIYIPVLTVFVFYMFRGSADSSENPVLVDLLMKKPVFFKRDRRNSVYTINKLIDINMEILDCLSSNLDVVKKTIANGRKKVSSFLPYTKESIAYIDDVNNQLKSILDPIKRKLEENRDKNTETIKLVDIIDIVFNIQNKLANEEFEKEKLSKYLQILRNKIVEEIIRRYLKILFMKTDSEKINAKISGPGIEIDFVKEITKSDITNYDYTGLKDLSDYMGINKEIISNMKINNKINNIEGIKNDIDVINKLNSLCKTLYGFIDELTPHYQDDNRNDGNPTTIVPWPNPIKADYEDLGFSTTENLSIDGTYNISIKNTGRQDSIYLKTAPYRIESRMKEPSLTLE